MTILEALKSALINQDYQFCPTRGSTEKIKFEETGKLVGCSLANRWEVNYNQQGYPTVFFKDQKGWLQAALTIDKTRGRFEGKERGSNGVCLLTPTVDREAVKLLGDPQRWQNAEIEKPSNFQYRDILAPQLDWVQYDYNLAEHLDKTKLRQSDTAVALIACDRVQYFEQVVHSIGQNEIVKSLPVFLFLDRSYRETQEDEITKHRQIIKKYLPHTVIIERPRNYGCGRNIIDARVQLFSNMGYEKVFVFEDDLIVSSNYLQLCLNLLKWGTDNFGNVGAVQAWNKCIASVDVKNRLQAEVQASFTNWWGYVMIRDAWQAIEPTVLEYQKLFLGATYSQRPHRSILEYFRSLMRLTASSKEGWELDNEAKIKEKAYFDSPPTGQDAITMHSFHKEGFIRLTTTVNRGKYIGRYGIHMNSRTFERDSFHIVELQHYTEDNKRTEFGPRATSQQTVKKRLEVITNV